MVRNYILYLIIKNVSSSISKKSMIANIVKTQIFHKMKYDLRGHFRSDMVNFMFKNLPFLLLNIKSVAL